MFLLYFPLTFIHRNNSIEFDKLITLTCNFVHVHSYHMLRSVYFLYVLGILFYFVFLARYVKRDIITALKCTIFDVIWSEISSTRRIISSHNWNIKTNATFHKGMIFYFNVLTRDKHNQVCWSHMISSKWATVLA